MHTQVLCGDRAITDPRRTLCHRCSDFMWRAPLLLSFLAFASCSLTQSGQLANEVALLSFREGVEYSAWEADAERRSARTAELLAVPLTVAAAVELAILNNPEIQIAFEKLAISRAEVAEQILPRNPLFGGEAKFGRGQQFEFTLTQPLVELLFLRASMRKGESALRGAVFAAAQEVQQLLARVPGALVKYRSAQALRAVHARLQEALHLGIQISRAQRDAGGISELELLQEEVLIDESQQALGEAERQVRERERELRDALGVAPGLLLKVDARLELPFGCADEVENSWERAAASDLLLKELHQRSLELETALGGTRVRAILGDMAVGTTATREAERTWFTGPHLDLPLPVFRWGDEQREILEHQLRRTQATVRARELRLSNEVSELQRELVAARKGLAYLQRVMLPRRKRLTLEMQKHFNGMVVGVHELLAAKRAELQVDASLVAAKERYWLARLALEAKVGVVKATLCRPQESGRPGKSGTTQDKSRR